MTTPEGVGNPTPLQKFYLTFGVDYAYSVHPYWAGADPRGWVLVLAPDEDAARRRVRMFVGLKWSHLTAEPFFGPDQRRHYPKGELAVIGTDLPADGLGFPTRQFGTSDPEYYGHDTDEVVAARIEGTLAKDSDRDAIEKLGYEAELVHRRCLTEGLTLFRKVTEVDSRVMAGELDWADPHNCPICDTSIT